MTINELYIEACRGNQSKEIELFRALAVRFRLFLIQRISNEQDAEEIVQESLIVIYGEYKALDIKSSFSAWAYKVLEHRLLNYLSRRTRSSARDKYIRDMCGRTESIDSRELDELKDRLLACLRKICRVNQRYARILNMHYQGYGTDEICARMKITSTNYYTILSRARSMLEYCLEKGEIV